MPRVLSRIRAGTLLTRLIRLGRHDNADSLAIWRQGGSTISQQLVQTYFLRSAAGGHDFTPNWRDESPPMKAGMLAVTVNSPYYYNRVMLVVVSVVSPVVRAGERRRGHGYREHSGKQ
jgi:hypothetical protein